MQQELLEYRVEMAFLVRLGPADYLVNLGFLDIQHRLLMRDQSETLDHQDTRDLRDLQVIPESEDEQVGLI